VARVGVTYLQMADRSALGLTSGVWPSQTADARGWSPQLSGRLTAHASPAGGRPTGRGLGLKGVPTDQLSQGR
jgi:hypothetical protein